MERNVVHEKNIKTGKLKGNLCDVGVDGIIILKLFLKKGWA
jgi:hypothetical protein